MKHIQERVKVIASIVALVAGIATPAIVGTAWVIHIDGEVKEISVVKKDVADVKKDVADVKEDLASFKEDVARRFDAVDQRFDAVDQRLDRLETIILDLPKLINVAAKNKSPS